MAEKAAPYRSLNVRLAKEGKKNRQLRRCMEIQEVRDKEFSRTGSCIGAWKLRWFRVADEQAAA